MTGACLRRSIKSKERLTDIFAQTIPITIEISAQKKGPEGAKKRPRRKPGPPHLEAIPPLNQAIQVSMISETRPPVSRCLLEELSKIFAIFITVRDEG
jgi:hypothetical protein